MSKNFEFVAHTADIKMRVHGATFEELFVNALHGMFAILKPRIIECVGEPDPAKCPLLDRHHAVDLYAEDETLLLIDFLSHVLSLAEIYHEAYLDVTIEKITKTHLHAQVHGVPSKGYDGQEIKAVTYHAVAITKKNDGVMVDIVFDI
jgi:SHS2 domain-containing protein